MLAAVVVLAGTIQPYNLDEAFGYLDSVMVMSAHLDFDGSGELDVSIGANKKLFASSILEAGPVSFKPQLNAETVNVGKDNIGAKVSVSFESGTSSTSKTIHLQVWTLLAVPS